MTDEEKRMSSDEQLALAIENETAKFEEYYLWLEKAMPQAFFDDIAYDNRLLIVHNLMGFNLQDYFTTILLRRAAIVMCLDSADADLRILENYALYGIKNYQAYVSAMPPPFPGLSANLRIAQITFTEAVECVEVPFPSESKEELRALIKQRNRDLTDEDFDKIIDAISIRFLRSLPVERLTLALDMFFRAKTRDNCQYEVRYNEDWEQRGTDSMQIVLAWRNTPKHHFLYRIARIIHRYGLVMTKLNAAYVDPYSRQNILLMAINIHGSDGRAAWDAADIPDLLRELATVKYFASFDTIDDSLIKTGVVPGRLGNFLRCCVNFIHQNLIHLDPNLYTPERIAEDLCRHPTLAAQLSRLFELKFDPDRHDMEKYAETRRTALEDIDNLDSGHPENDTRRKNVLVQALNLVHYTVKTNYYRLNYTSVSFRLDPAYLNVLPYDRKTKFPELPYGIFFMKGMHFFGYHIRFKDLARGGLRTVYPKLPEHVISERNNIFLECYNLAYTQHMKNKDIPEAGSKGVIFLNPWGRLESEALILKGELQDSKMDSATIENKLALFRKEQELEFLYQAQRSYVESLITLINCDPNGKIRAKHMIDYWKKPEYIYLGPDENMHDSMIQWIADFSKKYDYKPKGAFISGKPLAGINHKEYGVTSLGVNVFMDAALRHLDIDPENEPFFVKMSGGPDGDVAGNQILNLHKYYPETAKLIALTDVSGTIYDPEGLDLEQLSVLFGQTLPIRNYPPQKLHDGGFLLDKQTIKKPTAFAQHTLCWRKKNGWLEEDWLTGSAMNHLFRNNVHETKSDIFIPAGGRPRTLSIDNIQDFLDETGKPTSKAIIEGANLYLTPQARRFLEEKGVLVVKDSSANKTGVICSSFEVMCGLVLSDAEFLAHKETLVKEILERLKICASNEANLLLRTLKENGGYLTEISDKISQRINHYTYQILDYLEGIELSHHEGDPLIAHFLNYALPTLSSQFKERLLHEIPDSHKKAIIACSIASDIVYKRGVDWEPSIVEALPALLK